MNEIKAYKVNFEQEAIDAYINGEYIIPGLNALKVDELKSYNNMKNNNSFLKKGLVYYEVKPSVSLDDNKQYIINKGNPLKKAISIISFNKEILEYSNNAHINVYDINDNKICIDNFINCNDKYKVKETYEIDNTSLVSVNISSGDIIKVNNINLEEYKYLIKNIEYHNYEILPLEKLISENR